jgi:hypothetical protein
VLTDSTTEHWKFVQGVTPMSTIKEVVIAIVLYLVVIFGLQYIMKNFKPFQLKTIFIIHNLALSAGSLILLLLIIESIGLRIWRNGLFWGVCSEELWDDKRLVLYFYMNYLFKYYELIDTVFLVLKKKNLEFLHVYHHALTAVLCFSQIIGHTSVQWVPITLNLFVHVVMYYYYAMTASGYQIWWKKYLTSLQITQFVLDMGFVYFATGTWHAHRGFLPSMVNFGYCHGTTQAAYFGCVLLSSYLYLFVEFFTKTYSAPAAVKGAPQMKGAPATKAAPAAVKAKQN